jgi:ribosomal protein S12 methylthiotransferase
MNRKYTISGYIKTLDKLRNALPGVSVTTDVIVGFPGETKAMFGELCEFLKEAKFERLGSFMYSAEEGTPAAVFENQVGEKEKERRQKLVMSIQERINYSINQKKLGKTIKVLCEGVDKVAGDVYYGRSEADAPEIDGKVYFVVGTQTPALTGTPFHSRTSFETGANEGDFVDVKIEKVLDYDLYGEMK